MRQHFFHESIGMTMYTNIKESLRPNHDVHIGADNIEINIEERPLIAQDSIMIDNLIVILPQIENIEAQNPLELREADESLSIRNRQALTDEEPFLILSHSDTPEYKTHMQAKQVVQHVHNPNNEIVDGENEARLPTEDKVESQRNEFTIEDATSSRHEDVSRELSVLETTLLRRLPIWLSPLPTNRPIPAAYVSR
ncbi:hypothetical protein OnM2_057058, partial [Erysiphe neolycopersici]